MYKNRQERFRKRLGNCGYTGSVKCGLSCYGNRPLTFSYRSKNGKTKRVKILNTTFSEKEWNIFYLPQGSCLIGCSRDKYCQTCKDNENSEKVNIDTIAGATWTGNDVVFERNAAIWLVPICWQCKRKRGWRISCLQARTVIKHLQVKTCHFER